MGVEARSVRPYPGAPKRRLRNYLLDRRFQLKYTAMVVAVTLCVASILGALAYHESKGQTAALQIQLTMQPDLDPRVAAELESFGRERDREILIAILLGISALTIALGATGIIITHKVVGPAYKLRMLIGTIAKGHLRVEGNLRKGDELKDVFAAFNEMVGQLRQRREHEIDELEIAIAKAKALGVSEDVMQALHDLRDRMRGELA
jgi:nitrogen fixation/metabolism regulation signal transduction histidine kinase